MKAYLLIAVLVFVFSACRQEPKGTVIARVGEAELTLETARAHIDTTRGAIGFQLREYAFAWTTTELLYQEATRLGMETTPEFQRQIADVSRQLLTDRYLATMIAGDSMKIGEDSMNSYYTAHAKEFLLREPMLKLNVMLCRGRELASAFSASVVQKGSWSEAENAVLGDSTRSQSGYTEVSPQYYSQSTLYPPELWRVAISLGVNEVSFPIRSGENYYVLQLMSSAPQGKPADYEIVREEVRQRMIVERRRKQYTDLLGTLRSKSTVEIFIDGIIPVDSLHGRIHE